MKPELQQRTLRMELRASDDFVLAGIAASYNVWSQDLGGFVERIAPGAFSRSLREKADVKCLFNHDVNFVLGRTKSGTLTLKDTPAGLAFRCQLDRSSTTHQNVYASVKRGDINECSFAFTIPDGGEKREGNRRTLLDVDLFDVSVVTRPAYQQGTNVDARHKRGADYTVTMTGDWRDDVRRRLAELDAEYAAVEAREDEDIRKRAAAVAKDIAARG